MFAFGGCLKHLAHSVTHHSKLHRVLSFRFLTVYLLLAGLAILFSAPLRAGLAARGTRVLKTFSATGIASDQRRPDSPITNAPEEPQQNCTLTCPPATVPTNGQINTAVSFQATTTATGCASAPVYDWNFGDGTAHSSQQNTTHSYAAAGTFSWTLTTSANAGTVNIDTLVGGLGEGNPALSVPFGILVAVARDPLGRGLFVGDLLDKSYIRFINTSNAAVTIAGRTVAPGTVRFLAGGGEDLGNNVLGTLADLGSVAGVAVSNDGNVLYFTNSTDQQLRALNLSSNNVVVAGLTIQPGRVSTIPVSNVTFGTNLSVLTAAANGDLYVIDATPGVNSVFRVVPATGAATRVAGNGAVTTAGGPFIPGPATGLALLNPRALEFDNQGNLYIADTGHGRVIRIDSGGQATLLAQFSAGSGRDEVIIPPYNNPPHPAGLAYFNNKLYVAMGNGQTVVRIDNVNSTPIISGQVAVSCDYTTTNCGDGGSIAGALYSLNGSTSPQPVVGVEADSTGLYLLDQGTTQRGRIRFLNLSAGSVTVAGTVISANSVDTIAGNGLTPPYDGGLAGSALIGTPVGVALDPNGNLYLTDVITGHLRFVNRGTTTVTLFPGTEAQQAVLPGVIVRINKDAGTGTGGTDVPANRASFNNPQGVFATSQGVYIVDSTGGPTVPQGQLQNAKRTGVIRFINTTQNNVTFYPGSSSPIIVPPGNIARIAGKDNADGGDSGAGDNGFALSAQLIGPTDLVVANDGTMYIADLGYKKVRRVNPQTGVITSLSLTAKQYTGLGFDTSGRLYITNYDDNQLLRETAAGSGSFGVLASGLNRPRDVAVDASGFAYVVNSEQSAASPGTNAHRIMRVASDGTVTTFAGTTKGYSGDGGLATSAQLSVAPSPLVISSINAIYTPMGVGIVTSATGDVIFADSNNGRVRILSPAKTTCTRTGQITIAGLNPSPTLSALNPTSVLAASGAFTLTLTGTGFVPASVVRWNGADRPTAFVSTTQLTAQIPASDVLSAGTAQVTVFNPTPGGGTSSALTFTINAPNPVPTLAGLNPTSAVEGSPGFTLTVNGTGFISGSVVRWDGSPRQTTFVSPTQLTAQIQASDLVGIGSTLVTVFNPTPGGGTSNSLSFTIVSTNPAPSLTGISPNQAIVGGAAFTLTATGANFVSTSKVRWNGSDRTTTFVSATQLTAQIPASDLANAGTAQVTVFTPTPGGGVTAAQTFNINNPAPAIVSLNPNTANAGSSGITLTVNGTGFINGSVVRWNGNNRTTTFVSATQLTAQIPATDLTSAGTGQVTVFNPTPGGGTSGAVNFTINQAPNPLPAITNLNPNTAQAGSAAFTLTINGTGFISNSLVKWNGQDRTTTFVSATQLTAQIPASDVANTGTAQVTVVNPPSSGGGGGTSNAVSFTITSANPVPALTALNPNSAVAGGASFTLTITGINFVNGSVVRWNGSNRSTTFIDSTHVSAQITAADIASAGTAQVSVFNPAPGGGVSGTLNFTITQPNPLPTITSLNPTSVVAGSTGFTLTISGTGFLNTSTVWWNGAERQTTFVNATTLTIQVPASDIANAGTVAIVVRNPAPGGGSSTAATFTITQPNPVPALTTLNPNSAIAGGASFTLTITGINFVNGSVVRWNGNNRTTTFVSATQVSAQIPASDIASAGTAQVSVFNPAPGGGVSGTLNFTITQNNPVPTLTTLAPTQALAGSGAFTLMVTGTNFINGSVVRWNGNNKLTTFIDSTHLTAQILASDILNAGTAQVTVFNPTPGGGTSNALSFTIAQPNPVPTLASVSPNLVAAGGTTFTLTATGTNFINGSRIRWEGVEQATTFVSATQLTAQIPATLITSPGTARITVINLAPGGGLSNEVTLTIARPLANISAASFLGQMFAPESIIAAFGANLATGIEVASTTPLPTTLRGTTVRVRDSGGVERLAPLFFVSPGQINYLLPAGTANGTATITATSGNGDISVGTLLVSAVSPALFTANANGSGAAAAVVLRVLANGQQVFEPATRFDQTLNRFVPEPINLGPEGEQVYLVAYGSGLRGANAVTATLGGTPINVIFAGPQGGFAGLDQLNLGPVPRSLAGRGVVDLVVTADGKQANTVQFSIR